jgi:esterase/lipase
MENNTEKICFILIAGFAPDETPVLELKKSLEKRGYDSIAKGFFGNMMNQDFHLFTATECIKNISKLIDDAKCKYDKVFGIGISLGGAFLIEYAKKKNNLDGIASIGTPFRLKKQKLIKIGQMFFPLVYPVWKQLQKIKKLRLLPIGAGNMVVKYLQNDFIKGLDTITVPLLFLHSKKDPVTDYKAIEKFSAQISSTRKKTVFFDNGNHVINNDAESIITQALEFFDLNNIAEEQMLVQNMIVSPVEETVLS